MDGRPLSWFFRALGLEAYARRAEADEKAAEEAAAREAAKVAAWKASHPVQEAAEGPSKGTGPAAPPPPRWTFVKVPQRAITWRGKHSARIALPGELDGFGIWVKRYRLHEHAEHGLVLSIRHGSAWTAEKREKKSKGWKTVDRKQVDRDALHKMFEPVQCDWDDLSSDSEPDDEPDWREDGRFRVTHHVPAPVDVEERPIVDELLMESEEPSWREADK